jgi:hypothetical protein
MTYDQRWREETSTHQVAGLAVTVLMRMHAVTRKTYLYGDPRLLHVLMNISLYVAVICYNIYSTPPHLKSETPFLCPKHLTQQVTKRFNA